MNAEEGQHRERGDAETAVDTLFGDPGIVPGAALLLSVNEESEELVTRAIPGMPESVPIAIRAFKRTGVLDIGSEGGAMWVVISEALASLAMIGPPSPARLAELQGKLQAAPRWVASRWDERTAIRINELERDARQAWITALGAMPTIRTTAERPVGRVSVSRSEAAWEISDLFQIWDEPPIAAFDLWAYAPFRIMRLVDRQAWFDAIDNWSDPRLVQAALFGAELRDSPTLAVDFLRRAGPCFDEVGQPTRRSTAVCLCRVALEAGRQLVLPNEEEAPTIIEKDLPKFVSTFVDALVERQDGARIGAALSAWLFERAILRPGPATTENEVHGKALDALGVALASKGIAVRDYRDFAYSRRNLEGNRGALWRREVPAMLAAARTLSSAPSAEIEAHRKWLLDALQLTEEWRNDDSLDVIVRELAGIFGRGADSVAECRLHFEQLESARRRGEFARTNLEQDSSLPSLLLLTTLITLVDRALAADEEDALAYCVDRTFRIALTDGAENPAMVPRDVIAMALAVACVRWGVDGARTRKLLKPLSDDIEVVGRLILRLTKAFGYAFGEGLFPALGTTLSEVQGRARDWADATGRPIDDRLASLLSSISPPGQG